MHKLVAYPVGECPKPKKIVGRPCVDYAGSTLLDDWTFADGRASWDTSGAVNTYEWQVPETIGPGPAPLELKLITRIKT